MRPQKLKNKCINHNRLGQLNNLFFVFKRWELKQKFQAKVKKKKRGAAAKEKKSFILLFCFLNHVNVF